MPDIRELFDNPEEAFRTMWAGIQSHMHTMLVSKVTANSDGKTLQAVPAVKQRLVDKTGTQTTYTDMALLVDVPLHFPGGARMNLTHGVAESDEAAILFNGRAHDEWFQNGAGAMPVSERMHSLSDGIALPGLHSTPRELKQIDTAAMHLRDDAKLHVHETHPDQGHRTFSADPSTAPASDSFDPLSMASAFYHHLVRGASGLLGQAVSSGGTHEHGVTHQGGAFMRAMNGLHSVLAMPSGALLSAFNGAHTVTANSGGVQIASSAGIALQCPPGSLGLPSGSVGSSSLGAGAASSNVGPLSGDVTGTLPSVQVVALSHVDGRTLPAATSDSAAAAAGVPVGGFYRDTSVASGKTVIVMRAV